MNLFTKQPEGASPVLTPLCVRKGSMGCVSEGLIWFQGHAQSHLVQARRVSNPTSPDVCRTPVLWLQHHLSPVTNWQLKAKDVFLIILHSLNAAVTTVDAGMHAKLFCHVKISWDALKKKKTQNLWSLFSKSTEDSTFCRWWWKVFHKTKIKSWPSLKKHHASKICSRSTQLSLWDFIVRFLGPIDWFSLVWLMLAKKCCMSHCWLSSQVRGQAYHDSDMAPQSFPLIHMSTWEPPTRIRDATDGPAEALLNRPVVYSRSNQKLTLDFPTLGNLPNITPGWVTGPSSLSSLPICSGVSPSWICARVRFWR